LAGPAKKPWKRNDESINEADRLALAADLSAQRGEYEDADKLYDRAIALVPGNADLWLERTNLSRAHGNDPQVGQSSTRSADGMRRRIEAIKERGIPCHYAKPAGVETRLRDLLN